MGSIGCLGNALSIVAVYKADDNLTSTSIYLIALAITDSLCLVCYICVHIFKTISSPVLFRVVTVLYDLMIVIFKSISHYLLIVITVERYMSIHSPFTVQVRCTSRSAKLNVFLISVKPELFP